MKRKPITLFCEGIDPELVALELDLILNQVLATTKDKREKGEDDV